MTVRHPPGRAGRTWLGGRLTTARRGVELLERKRDVLRREERRLATLHDQTGAAWARHQQDADRWLVRALVLGGREALDGLAPGRERARATVRWETSMGVTFPGEVDVALGPPPVLAGPAALGPAADAHRDAVVAAAHHAATLAALERVRAELASTSRRLRAIRDRLLPRLEEALRALELGLEEVEREEVVRTRWAPDAAPVGGRADARGDR